MLTNDIVSFEQLGPGIQHFLTLQLFKFIIQDTISHDAPKRHKLSVHVMSTVPAADTQTQTASTDSGETLISPVELPQVRTTNCQIHRQALLIVVNFSFHK